MNKNDLDDIMAYDKDAGFSFALGTFLMSGAGWIIIEQMLGPDGPKYGALFWFCVPMVGFGLVMLLQGWRQSKRKRDRINRIFEETIEYPIGSAGGSGFGPTHGT